MFKRYVFCEGLTNLLGSDGKYLINNEGQIKNIKGNDLEYNKDENGDITVYCSGWDGERTYRVIDLVAIQFKSLSIPLENYGDVIAFNLDNNKLNVHASNIGYRFKNMLLEHKIFKEFYYVPGYPNIVIDLKGNILNSQKGLLYKFTITKYNKKQNIKGGYYAINTTFTKGTVARYTRHRALCLTFKEFPNNVDVMTVNHINGIPGDDRLDNLEWCTRGENNLHAYVNDLKDQHKRVLVRDILTGNVKEYYSLAECARVLGYSQHSTMTYRLFTSKFGQVFQDGTQIKLKDDERDWIIPDDPVKEIKLAQENINILVRNIKTNEMVFYKTITDASVATKVNYGTVYSRVKENDFTPVLGYQFKNNDNLINFPNVTEEELNDSYILNSFEIEARNILTEESMLFPSVRKASEYFNYNFRNALLDKKQPLLESGWQIKYKIDTWFDTRDFDEQIYKSQQEIMAYNEETKDIIISRDATSLGQLLKLDRKSIRKASYTRGNAIYNGYRFRLGVTCDPWPTTQLKFKTRS